MPRKKPRIHVVFSGVYAIAFVFFMAFELVARSLAATPHLPPEPMIHAIFRAALLALSATLLVTGAVYYIISK